MENAFNSGTKFAVQNSSQKEIGRSSGAGGRLNNTQSIENERNRIQDVVNSSSFGLGDK